MSTQGLATPRDRSAFVPLVLVPARLAVLADELDVHRRLRHGLQRRLGRPVLGRLLLLFAGSVSRAHRWVLRVGWTVPVDASRRLTRRFTGNCRILAPAGPVRAAGAEPQLPHRAGQGSGRDRRTNPGHEV